MIVISETYKGRDSTGIPNLTKRSRPRYQATRGGILTWSPHFRDFCT